MGTRCEELGRPAGGRGAFLPMVVESFGGWHEVAEREVRKLGPVTLPRGKRGNCAPLGATSGSDTERQRGNLGKPGAFPA